MGEALRSGWANVEGLPVHFRLCAEQAPAGSLPVVLVHGIGVASPSMVPVSEALASHHAVYAPDLPGFGESGKPERTLTVNELADSLAGWMNAIGLERAILLGTSFGCQVAVELALHYPELVERLVLQAPTMDPAVRSMRHQVLRWLRNAPGEHSSQSSILVRAYAQCGVRRVLKTSATPWRIASRRSCPTCMFLLW
jgi:pimeloyl-ACP methyl ester carboxylesterase